MKKILLVLLFSFSLLSLTAQWTYNPDNPMVVSNEVCPQKQVRLLEDGQGGVFVFWLDSRSECSSSSNSDIYGQHYDSDGIAQWENGGKMIWNLSKNISSAEIIKGENTGEMIAAVFTNGGFGQDSLLVQKINAQGELAWDEPLLLATNDGCVGNFFLGFESIHLSKDDNGYVINLVPIYCGGANGCRITRFDDNGNLTGELNGTAVGNQFYIGARGIDIAQDGTNDLFLFYTGGNGAGAPAYCMRTDDENNVLWGPVNVLEGTNGLNYQYHAMADPSGIAVIYQSFNNAETGIDLFIRKLNNDGTWAWNGDIKNVSSYEGTQGYFSATQDEDYYYFIWSDSRVEGDGYYAQKIDKATGEEVWTSGGKLIYSQTAYAFTPQILLQPDGNLMALVTTSMNSGALKAVLVDADGDWVWSEPSTLAGLNYLPFYSDQRAVYSMNQVLVAWTRFTGQDGVYIARVAPPQVSRINNESISSNEAFPFKLYPCPASQQLTLESQTTFTNASVVFRDAMGRIVQVASNLQNNRIEFSIDHLPSGYYVMEVHTDQERFIEKWVKH